MKERTEISIQVIVFFCSSKQVIHLFPYLSQLAVWLLSLTIYWFITDTQGIRTIRFAPAEDELFIYKYIEYCIQLRERHRRSYDEWMTSNAVCRLYQRHRDSQCHVLILLPLPLPWFISYFRDEKKWVFTDCNSLSSPPPMIFYH